jgi:hypothetical protein
MYKKYISIVLSLSIVSILSYIVIDKKEQQQNKNIISIKQINTIYTFDQCGAEGKFFLEKGIVQPVTIDLTQKDYKGIVLYYGENKVYHPKGWERFEYLGDYVVDKKGNLYLVPMPFISITKKTFDFLKNLYKVDTDTGKLSSFMHFDDVHPSSTNPFGLNAIAYDCNDSTLWVSALDESDYQTQRGVIYHIDPKNKKILSKFEGWDALALTLAYTDKGKFLFMGSAKDSGFYAAKIEKDSISKPIKLFEIPNPEEHIQKIIIHENNELEIKTIPFTYTLIAESSNKDGNYYKAAYDKNSKKWSIERL